MSSLEPCSNTALLDQYLEEQNNLAAHEIESRQERADKKADYIDNAMCSAKDSDEIIEIISNDDFVISSLDDLCIIDCNQPFNKLTFDQVRQLAQAAYAYNNRIAHALAGYWEHQ